MAGQIGKATIEIVADLSKFPAELKAKLKAAFAEGVKGVDMHGLSDEAEKEGGRAAKRAAGGFERSAKGEFERVGKAAGRGLLSSIAGIFRRDGGKSGGGFSGAIRGMFAQAQDAVKTGVQGLQQAGSSVGSAISGLAGGGGDIASLVKVVAIAAAIPAVLGLAGAVVHLTGILLALPAAIGFVVAAVAPMVIAFQGFGDAIGAGFSGDIGKFNDALKNLPPGMRAVVKEIVAFKKPLQDLKRNVQQAFFGELVGKVRPLLAAIIPVLSRGLVTVAGALSEVFAGLVTELRRPEILGTIQALFNTTSDIVSKLGPPLLSLFHAFFSLMGAGLPFIERIFGGLGDGIATFAGWLEKIVADGRFGKFLNNALSIGGDLIDLLGSIGKLIGTIFGGQDVADASGGFIKSLQEGIDKLNAFFKTAEGKRTLDDMVKSIKLIGEAFVVLIGFIITFQGWVFAFIDAVKGAGKAVGDFFTSIGSWFASAYQAFVDFFTNLPTTLSTLLASAVDALSAELGRIVGVVLALPFLIYNGLLALPGILAGAFRDGFNAAKNFVDNGIRDLWALISSIPGRVRSIGPALLDAARSLGRKIGDGLSEIGNFASNIGGRIVSAVKGGINRIIDGINGGIADIDNKIPISLPRLPHFERGGVIDSPTVALIGEKGKKEVVLPLTDPQRTRELAQQSGLTRILGSGGGAPTVNLTAILDGMGLIKVIDMRVDAAMSDQGSELAFGART